MKKVTSLLLALVMALALSVTAFAHDSVPKSEYQDVTAGYTAENVSKSATVYDFTITWDASKNNLAYYGEQATYTWNTSELKYKPNTESETYKAAGWYGEAKVVVTVTNRSEVALEFTTKEENNTYGLDISANKATTQTVKSATTDLEGNSFTWKDANKVGNPQSADITYTIKKGNDSTAIDTTATATGNKVATITITVDDAR